MLAEACVVSLVAVTCLNESSDTSACLADKTQAEAILYDFQTKSKLVLKAADVVQNKKGNALYRSVWEDKKGAWTIVQYTPKENVCVASTPEEYQEQHRKESEQSRKWL